MAHNRTEVFSHSNADTARNFVNGIKKFHLRLFPKKQKSQDIPSHNADLTPQTTEIEIREKNFLKFFLVPRNFLLKKFKLDLSNKNPIALYRNNFEPQVLKDVSKLIGAKKAYIYIIRDAVNLLFQELIPEFMTYIMEKLAIKAEKRMVPSDTDSPVGPNLYYFIVQAFNNFFAKPIMQLSQFISERIINSPINTIKIKHLINDKIGSENFLSLYLHDHVQNENQMLVDNIFSVLKAYSATIAKTISLALHATYIYRTYKFFPGAKLTFKIGATLIGLKTLYEMLSKKIFTKIGEEDVYKIFTSKININQDQYDVKATVFTPGIKHLNDREKLKDKHELQLNEEKLFLYGLDTVLDVESIQRTIVSCYSAINYANPNLRNGATWFAFRTDFNRLNNIFFNIVKTIFTFFNSDPSFALQAKQINKVIRAVDSYNENNALNDQIYRKNNSTKLIISDLKADVVSDNQTIVDFSNYSLSIDISSGKHYLMEGQNSVGKSLLLKLLSGYSGGLAIKGSISYPQIFDKSNIYYFSQEDYIGYFKPVLHRLAAPKMLPVDVIIDKQLVNSEIIQGEEFNDFVNFMAIILFRMKYIAHWRDVNEARLFLLKNYDDYVDLVTKGSEETWESFVEPQNNLTGGQIKKLGLASAIYRGVKLLILDESFNAIDQPTKLEIYKLITEYSPESTVLVLQHQVADNLIELRQNKEQIGEVHSLLKEINEINRSNYNKEIEVLLNQAADKITYFGESQLEEELDFYNTVITMSRNQTEDNKVATWFTITNLHNHNETLVEFYENKDSMSEATEVYVNVLGESS